MGDRLREALDREWWWAQVDSVEEAGEIDAAARRVLDARPPDYEAAARWLLDLSESRVGNLTLDDIRQAVDAAIGGGLIIDEEKKM